MLIVGLTGSIGMGKTTVLSMFADQNIPTFDADKAVHDLYEGVACAPIQEAFPGTVVNGAVDRDKLSAYVVGNSEAIKQLEDIIHPLVREERHKFLIAAAKKNAPMAVLDVPLLFEIQADKDVDITIVVSAPGDVQKQRVLSRPGMTASKLSYILSRQIPDNEKRARADFVVDTGTDLQTTRAEVDKIINILSSRTGTAYRRFKEKYVKASSS